MILSFTAHYWYIYSIGERGNIVLHLAGMALGSQGPQTTLAKTGCSGTC